METVETIILEKIKTIRPLRPFIRDPWLTSGLQTCMRKQKALYQRMIKSDNPDLLAKYKTYRNVLKKIIRQCKSQYNLNKCIEFKQNSRKLWELINKTISKSNNKLDSIDRIKIGNVQKNNANSITTAFCNDFSGIGKKFASKIKQKDRGIFTQH